MMTALLVIFGCFAVVMAFAYIEKVIQLDRCQADSSLKLDEQRSKYHSLYHNVEKKFGYCEARQAARKPGEYEAQMFKLEPHSPAADDVKAKSIEAF